MTKSDLGFPDEVPWDSKFSFKIVDLSEALRQMVFVNNLWLQTAGQHRSEAQSNQKKAYSSAKKSVNKISLELL